MRNSAAFPAAPGISALHLIHVGRNGFEKSGFQRVSRTLRRRADEGFTNGDKPYRCQRNDARKTPNKPILPVPLDERMGRILAKWGHSKIRLPTNRTYRRITVRNRDA